MHPDRFASTYRIPHRFELNSEVEARTACELWMIPRRVFQRTLRPKERHAQLIEDYTRFLDRVPVFDRMEVELKSKVAEGAVFLRSTCSAYTGYLIIRWAKRPRGAP